MGSARRALFAINGLMALLGSAGTFWSIAVIARQGLLCTDCITIPPVWGYSALGVTFGVLLISALAILAVKRHHKCTLVFMVMFVVITFAFTVMGTSAFLLFTQSQDSGALQPTIDGLVEEFKQYMVVWGVNNPPQWVRLQAYLECCGVDFEATYVFPEYQARMLQLHTGPRCNVMSEVKIDGYHVYYPSFDAEGVAAIKSDPAFQLPQPYLCETNAKAMVASYTAQIAGGAAFFGALQLLSIVLTVLLVCQVKEEDGGFAQTDESGAIKRENPLRALSLAVPKAKTFANHASMRVFQVAMFAEQRTGPTGPLAQMAATNPSFTGDNVEFGKQFHEKYARMRKSGLPENAVRHAMARDGVDCPREFFDSVGERSATIPPGMNEGLRNIVNRVSRTVRHAHTSSALRVGSER
jgi:hypothetical protein